MKIIITDKLSQLMFGKLIKSAATLIVALSASPVSAAVPDSDVDAPVFITIGQSNADGSGEFDTAEDARLKSWYDSSDNPRKMKIWYRSSYIVNQPDGARWVFDGKVQDVAPGWLDLWYRNENTGGRTAMNMIHGYGTWSTGDGFDCAQGRRGMEGQFGMRFQNAFPDKELYVVKLGCSGSSISTWTGNDNHNWEYFYSNIYKPAIEDLLSQGKRPILTGIWWMQGCGDADRSESYYKRRLRELIAKCRSDLGFPAAHFYIGHVVKPGESVSNPTASRQFGPGVRKAQDALASPESLEYVGNATIIDGSDSPFQSDNLHWNQIGVNRLGDKIADRVIGSSDITWTRFTTPGHWVGLDSKKPEFVPEIGNPEITYTKSDGRITATLDYGTWSETKTASYHAR